MPLHIEEMTSDVAVFDGEIPLTPAQMQQVVDQVMEKIKEQQRKDADLAEATKIKREATPFF